MSAHSKRNLALTALTGVGALVAANYYISPTSPRHHGRYTSTQSQRESIFERTKLFETKLFEEAKKMKPNMEDEREAKDVDEMVESIFSS